MNLIPIYMRHLLRKKKEYLLRREQEQRDKIVETQKKQVLEHLEETTKLTHELKKNGKNIMDELIYNQKITDDTPPYPKLLVTTSKKPSSKLLQFSKHLSLIFNGLFFMRGNTTKEELSDNLHKNYFTMLIMVHENKGMPSSLLVSEYPFGNTYKFSIHNFVLSRTVNLGQYCHLVTNGIHDNIKQLFGKMLPSNKNSKRILTISNLNEIIAFRHYLIEKCKRVELKPDMSFDMRLYEIRKGTFEMDGELEWVYKPFINSQKRINITWLKMKQNKLMFNTN